jgi:hypothetical protein
MGRQHIAFLADARDRTRHPLSMPRQILYVVPTSRRFPARSSKYDVAEMQLHQSESAVKE